MNQERVTCPLSQCDWYFDDPGFAFWQRDHLEWEPPHGTISEHVARVESYRATEIQHLFFDHWDTHTPVEILTEIRDLNDRVQRMDALIQSSKEAVERILLEEL